MSEEIKDAVREQYAAVARSSLSNSETGAQQIAEAFGYSPEELTSIPAAANMGLSCGNPTVLAALREGEVVVDLGSGGGLDVFLAAKKVGPSGKAIGIDMTPDMIARARENAEKGNYTNVEFHHAEIESLPLEDNSVDCVISNCVLNLVPEKSAAFNEIFRVLKPGGRLAASDIALRKPLPEKLAKDVAAYIGCIAGAIEISVYEQGLRSSGFSEVRVIDSEDDLNAYAALDNQVGCCSPAMDTGDGLSVLSTDCCQQEESTSQVHAQLARLIEKYDINEYAASVKIYAIKPAE